MTDSSVLLVLLVALNVAAAGVFFEWEKLSRRRRR